MHAGPAAGLAAIAALERPLADYHLFYAARADMLERSGGDPLPDLERAMSLAMNEGEKRLLERRLTLGSHARYPPEIQRAESACGSEPTAATG